MNEELNAQVRQILADAKIIIDNQNKILSNIPTTQALNAEFAKKVNINDFTAIKNAMNIHLSQKNFGANGYTKLPNGLILQWGRCKYGSNGRILFPVTFTKVLSCVATFERSISAPHGMINIAALTNSDFHIRAGQYSPLQGIDFSEKDFCNFFAIGY